ncbi:fars-1 [Pristionchus pacificus]|nr:fars-1 [Pristionchus pacificus]
MGDSTALINQLDVHLALFSYIDGYVPSSIDPSIAAALTAKEVAKHQHVARWHAHIGTLVREREECFSSAPSTAFGKQLQLQFPSNEQPAPKMTASGDSSSSAPPDLPQFILDELAKGQEVSSIELASRLSIDHQKLIGAVKSLLSHEGVISTRDITEKRVELTKEGVDFVENGSAEFRTFERVAKEGGTPQTDIMKEPYGKVGISKAITAGWIAFDKSGGSVIVVRKVDSTVDTVSDQLKALKVGDEAKVDDKARTELKKRKLISEVTIKVVVLSKGPLFTTTLEKPEAELTPEMLASGSWKTTTFKKLNFEAMGVQPDSGHLHPLMKVRSEFRQIFFQMGFSEMPTNQYVESSFWNFDALFQPQQHPARDAHDTFFISEPALSTKFPAEYLEKVKTVHSKGGFGSDGYGYDWKEEEAQKNVMRTHTTAVSARQLYKLAQEGFKPTKMFSIDRVFRNETLDATHLAEFHQVEGVIADRNLSLSHVMGLFREFFRKCGIENLKFKPTYNPYTEPSMEIFAYHDGLKKWVEIGNSGMFRPEMLLPMGLPADVNVAGYGLSLERPTMIRYGIDNIRDLFGSKVKLDMIYNNPICRLDKK